MADLLTLQREIHENARAHGFWEGPENDNIPTKLALIHSEISEALEDFRQDRMDLYFTTKIKPGVNVNAAVGDHPRFFVDGPSGFPPTEISEEAAIEERKPEGFGIELADALIRILDLAGRQGLDMGALVELKMEYNRGRAHMHGGRRV